jgi:hypothetical protein
MRVHQFCIPATAAAMLLAIAGCTDSSANGSTGMGGVAPAAAAPAATAAAAPATFPPEARADTMLGMDGAIRERRENQ